MTAEHQRLSENSLKKTPLEQWGPYVSERQWGTVREDYSSYGDAWNYFPFQHAHCRAYQWGEDGLAGISDFFQNLCFALSIWNGKDHILKERLFGLGNNEGNHGEDVKELYYYLDNIPTHYYMEYLYKYPQQEFPYQKLLEENRKRSKLEPEYEILDTGIFNNNEYFDVTVSYAKEDSQDIYIKIDIHNRYHKAANITVLPTLWFYNRRSNQDLEVQPSIYPIGKNAVKAEHGRLGDYYFYYQAPNDQLFTDNKTNTQKVTGIPNDDIFVKDAFHDAIMGVLFGRIAKKQIIGDKPFKRNLPTAKQFVINDPGEFESEKQQLISLVRKFYKGGPEILSKDPHPFFGKLTIEEWDKLSMKHLDHHLQQFGV